MMSALLDKAKQQNAQSGSPQQLDGPETMETLNSILAALEAQNERILTLANRQEDLANFLKALDEATTNQLDRIITPASTSSPSSDVSARIASIESRQNEIANTLGEFAQSLNGEKLNDASRSLVAETQRNRETSDSAIKTLQSQADANHQLVNEVGRSLRQMKEHAAAQVEKAVEQVTGEASATITANLDHSNERAERIIATTARLEVRQLWSSAAAMFLVLIPVALVIAGAWMSIAGLITGVQWALDVEASIWLGIGRWLVVGTGLSGPVFALFVSVRWVVSLVESWKGRGMPSWPRWRGRRR